MLQLALRLLRPQGQRRELLLFLLALIIAITSISSVSLTADRLQQALQISSRDFIAADRVLRSDNPIDADWQAQAQQQGLQSSTTVSFNSMLFVAERFQLADIRAVDDAYPLRGTLELMPQRPIRAGEIWLSAQLISLLQVQPGDAIEIGNTELTFAGQLVKEPDAGFSPMRLAPHALIHLDDLDRTGVVQPGSRVRWQYLYRGTAAQLEQFDQWLKPLLDESHSYYGSAEGDTPVAQPLQRAARFFQLAAVIGVLLGALAMGITLRHYARAQFDTVALLKTLGASATQTAKLYWLLLSVMMTVGLLLGGLLGWLLHLALIASLGELIPADMPLPSAMPLLLTLVLALLLTAMTAYLPFARLLKIPPLRVLRRELTVELASWQQLLVLGAGPLLLVWLISGDALLTLALLLGQLAIMLVTAAIAWLLLLGSNRLAHRGALHLALQRLRRHRWQSMLQLAGIATALLLTALVGSVRSDLTYIWQQRLPADAPNRFMLNIAPYDVERLQSQLEDAQIQTSEMVPMVRARIHAVNGQSLSDWFSGQVPARIDRERNLTWLAQLPNENRIIAGRWWPADGAAAEISLEQRFAERLGVNLGDQLSFNLDGTLVSAPVTSIRSVTWETMQPNFFIIFSPGVLSDFPATYLASFRIPAAQRSLEARIVRNYPTASVINIEALLAQLDEVLSKVAAALGVMMVMVVAAGLMVLLALLQVSMQERQQELLLMRTLGARATMMRGALRWELIATGTIAGLSAALAVELASGLLAYLWLQVSPRAHLQLWLWLPLAGALLSLGAGMMQIRPLLTSTLAQRIKAF